MAGYGPSQQHGIESRVVGGVVGDEHATDASACPQRSLVTLRALGGDHELARAVAEALGRTRSRVVRVWRVLVNVTPSAAGLRFVPNHTG